MSPGAVASPGETVAAASSADGARVNPAAPAQSSRASVRLVHATELARGAGPGLDATSLSWSSGLPLGFGMGFSAAWQRPIVAGQLGHRVSAEGTLAFAPQRGLSFGARARVASSVASPALAGGDGVSIDVGALFRPTSWLSLGLATANLLGPRAPEQGLLRSVSGGFAVRPTTTDALTIAADGTLTEAGTGSVRVATTVALPFGRARAEGVMDLPSSSWRAMAGIELAWGAYSLGAGALFGQSAARSAEPLGFYATAGWDSERNRALPEPGQLVVVRIDDDLGAESLVRLLLRLERLREDPSVTGIVFAPRAEIYGLAGGDELREAFARLRAAGKRVACHLDDAGNSALLACTAAERVAIDPIATVRTGGLRSIRFFLGDALSELGVRTQFVRIGPWKSAAEQFTRGGSSPEALAQEQALLDSMLAHLTERVGASRRWSSERARQTLFAGPFSAREAVERGLVDESATLESFGRAMAVRLGASQVRLGDYVARQGRRWAPGRAIAVLHVHGDIVDGESQDIPLLGDMVGDRTITQAVEALAGSSRVAAVVVRVDSPGGSAGASERMWRALNRLARVKPVFTSIGRNAASGGYYVAAPGREVFTLPTSITGSIGIFFGKVDVAPLLARLHVGVETTRRGERADMDSVFRSFTADEVEVVSRLIREHYNLFLDRVAQGRRRTRAQVHAVGEGRVFTGRAALANGLADREGGLLAAIDRAAEVTGLGRDFEVVTLPRADAGILGLVRSLVNISDPRAPVAQVFSRSELAHAARWLFTVARAPSGQAMALTEWPVLAP